jgi:hypothetical protein
MDPMLIYRSKPELGRSGRRGRTQRVWMRRVQPGDVLLSPRGSLRVVREVSFYGNGDLRSLTFAIKHGSWTRRPYTIMGYTDLMGGWRPAGARVALDGELDTLLLQDIQTHRSPCAVPLDVAVCMP